MGSPVSVLIRCKCRIQRLCTRGWYSCSSSYHFIRSGVICVYSSKSCEENARDGLGAEANIG